MLNGTPSLDINLFSFSNNLEEFSRQQRSSELRHHGLLLGQWLLELPELKSHRGKIAEALALLRAGSVRNLTEALGGLRHQIQALLPKGVATLVFSASRERSAFLFSQSVVEVAQAYRSQGDFATPASLYSLALQALPNTSECQGFRTHLEREFAALRGEGSFSDSLKLGLERASHELNSPMVLAMAQGV